MANGTKKVSPYGNIKFESVENYHNAFSGEVRETLDRMRAIIKKAIPKATQVISYNMPAFKNETILVYYAASKEHLGFYPTPGPIKAFHKELAGFKTSKGAVQFPYNKTLPSKLITDMVKYRVLEAEEKNMMKQAKAVKRKKAG